MDKIKFKSKFFKQYNHLDKCIKNTKLNRINTLKYCNDIDQVSKHHFLPFIKKVLKVRKLKKVKSNKEKENKNNNYKIRNLMVCSHKDSLLLSIYRNKLLPIYEQFLKDNGLENNVIAYRKIKIDEHKGEKFKCNINFAQETFAEIEKITKTNGECVVLTFDIKKFFDTINHLFLLKELKDIFKTNKLSKDWFHIFKNITRYSYIDYDDIKNILHKHKSIKIDNKRYFTIEEYKKYVLEKDDNKYKFIKKNINNCGIPQGSPISDIFANIYMKNFDLSMHNLENEIGCIYKRYSDDIIFVCKNIIEASKIKEYLNKNIKEINLELQEEKETLSVFAFKNNKIVYNEDLSNNVLKHNKPLNYLGFEFTNNNIIIRSSSISKQIRKIHIFIQNYFYKIYNKIEDKKNSKIENYINRSYIYRHLYKKENKNKIKNRISKIINNIILIKNTNFNKFNKNKHNKLHKTILLYKNIYKVYRLLKLLNSKSNFTTYFNRSKLFFNANYKKINNKQLVKIKKYISNMINLYIKKYNLILRENKYKSTPYKNNTLHKRICCK